MKTVCISYVTVSVGMRLKFVTLKRARFPPRVHALSGHPGAGKLTATKRSEGVN